MKHSISKKVQGVTGFNLWNAFYENDDGLARSRRNILYESVLCGIGGSITTGVYFTGLMLAMGAGESYIGFVSAVVSFCGLFQILSPLIMERLSRRKPLLITMQVIKLVLNTLGVGLIPLLPMDSSIKLVLFLVTLCVVNVLTSLYFPGLIAVQLQSLPMVKRIDFIALNNLGVSLLNQVSAFLAGVFLDQVELDAFSLGSLSPTMTAILILRFVALLLGCAEIYCFSRLHEGSYGAPVQKHSSLRLLLIPIKNRAFMGSILNQVLWTFAVAISGQFFTIYLLEDVHMSYSLISLCGFISLPLTMLSTPFWTKALRQKDWMKVLAIAQLGFVVCYILNSLVTASSVFIYFLMVIISSIFSPGVNNAHGNLMYRDMSEENRTSYIGFHSILTQLATFLGNSAGIWFIGCTDGMALSLPGITMGNKQYINLASAGLVLLVVLYSVCTYIRSRKKTARV